MNNYVKKKKKRESHETFKSGINLLRSQVEQIRHKSTCDMLVLPTPPPASSEPSFLTAPSQRCRDQFDYSSTFTSALPAHPAQTSPPLGCFDHARLVCCNFLPLLSSPQSLSGFGSRQKSAPQCQTINMLLIMWNQKYEIIRAPARLRLSFPNSRPSVMAGDSRWTNGSLIYRDSFPNIRQTWTSRKNRHPSFGLKLICYFQSSESERFIFLHIRHFHVF